METEHWRRIDQLYHEALELERSQRAAFLAQACGGDERLAREVGSLLDQAEETDGFLESPAFEVQARSLAAETGTAGEQLFPAVIGRYRIVRTLGEGGMGAVYEAEQEEPRRIVALKVIRPGLATPEGLARFRQESQALGRLQHPGIAQIYEAGAAETGFGLQPYFAMELIRGLPLGQHAEECQLDTRQRLMLMVRICDAVQHAHQRGLIHRDLKPGNIVVDQTGQPKILDFGVARVIGNDANQTRRTDFGQLVRTLAYMSPEQVLADPHEVDTRSDVYSLGVILYELVSGRLPYDVDRRQLPEAVRTIREIDPRPLSPSGRHSFGDIEIIVGKALEKDKTRRYAGAAELAADIQRYLNDEPITARPPSAGYQLRKFAQRRRALVAGVAAVFVALLAGVITSAYQAARANQFGRAALAERDRAAIAEQVATRDRDRALRAERAAVAAEERALQERNRALTEKRRADDEAATARAVNDFLRNDLLAQADPNLQAGANRDADLKVRTALNRAAARIPGKFDRQPLVEASIRQTIGNAYSQLGIYPPAQRQLERAVELRRRVLGEGHPDTLRVMRDLGAVYRRRAMFAQAESLWTTVLESRRRLLGEYHLDTLASINDLAVMYMSKGKYSQAEPLWTRSLRIQRRLLGDNHRNTANTMNSLAWVYRSAGRYEEAEPLQIQSLAIWRQALGEEHPNTLASMSGLAALYNAEGKYAQAEALAQKVLEVRRRVLGEEHPNTLASMDLLAATYRAEGKYGQAESLYTKALESKRRVQGENHPAIAVTMNGLAALYRIENKYAQAEPLQIGALGIQRHALGEEHRSTLVTMNNLAALYQAEGKFAEAEALLRRTLEIEHRVLGEEHPETLRSMDALASLCRVQGRDAEAELILTGVLEIVRRLRGPKHPRTAEVMVSLGEVQLRRQNYLVVEPLIREVLGVWEKTNPDAWKRYYSEALLGASLAGQKRYAEAEPLLISGYQGMLQRESKIPGESREVLSQAGERIAELYQSWGRPEKATEWRKETRLVRAGPTQ